jgi:hypothetical protein
LEALLSARAAVDRTTAGPASGPAHPTDPAVDADAGRQGLTPVTVYVVTHPRCADSAGLAKGLFAWLRLQGGEEATQEAGLPVWFRSDLEGADAHATLSPPIAWGEAHLNVVVVLCGDEMALDPLWWAALEALVRAAEARPGPDTGALNSPGAALILPVGVSTAVGRLGFLSRCRQVIRLPGAGEGKERASAADGQRATARMRALRRAVMEAILRRLPAARGVDAAGVNAAAAGGSVPEVKVFLSHAKADGRIIAERLRDGLAHFSQLRPWFDANDLPAGEAWSGRMVGAARAATDGLIAVVSDAYHSRYWCQREAQHAREPRRLEAGLPLWGVQPTVAVVSTTGGARRVMPALDGVLHIGWRSAGAIGAAAAQTGAGATISVGEAEAAAASEAIEDVVEWWLLEALLARVAERRARDLLDAAGIAAGGGLALLTFTPDPYTLGRLLGAWRREAQGAGRPPPDQGSADGASGVGDADARPGMPACIGYPGFGLPSAGKERLIEVLLDHGYGEVEAKGCLVPLLTLVGEAQEAPPPLRWSGGRWRAGALDQPSAPGSGRAALSGRQRLRVALSAGGADDELAKVGLGVVHIDDLQVRVCRSLLDAGHRLAFGGTFDAARAAPAGAVGAVNLTARLLQLAQGWAAARSDEGADRSGQVRAVSEQELRADDLDRLREPPLLNYVRWTAAGGPSIADQAERVGACRFVEVLPAGRTKDQLKALVEAERRLAAGPPAWADPELAARHHAEHALLRLEIGRAELDALTAMRRRSAKDCQARVLMAGKINRAHGWLPGVAEELEASLWAHHKDGSGEPEAWTAELAQPVLLLGGFGGVCRLLADFLAPDDAGHFGPWPALPRGLADQQPDPFAGERAVRWARLESLMGRFRAHLNGLQPGEPVFPADGWTHATLTKATFMQLLAVDSPTAALRLVRRVFGG